MGNTLSHHACLPECLVAPLLLALQVLDAARRTVQAKLPRPGKEKDQYLLPPALPQRPGLRPRKQSSMLASGWAGRKQDIGGDIRAAGVDMRSLQRARSHAGHSVHAPCLHACAGPSSVRHIGNILYRTPHKPCVSPAPATGTPASQGTRHSKRAHPEMEYMTSRQIFAALQASLDGMQSGGQRPCAGP